jgi:hypothetical protein
MELSTYGASTGETNIIKTVTRQIQELRSLNQEVKKVKQSHYRPGGAQRVPGS